MKAIYKTRRVRAMGAALAFLPLLLATACNTTTPAGPVLDTPSTPSSQAQRATRTPKPQKTSSFAGVLDTSFGDGGRVTTDLGSTNEEVRGVIAQADGKIVALGESWPGIKPRFSFTRYDAKGNLDPTFGEDGKLVVEMVDHEYEYSKPGALIQQPDGKIIAVGATIDFDAGHMVFAALRLNADGTPDEDFGNEGKALVPVDLTEGNQSEDEAQAVALAPDGKIVIVGITGRFPHSFGTVRLNEDGSLDETFGDGGRVVTTFPNDAEAHAVAAQADGKILVGGYATADKNAGMEGNDYALIRYNTDGTLDETFGKDGIVLTDFVHQRDYIEAVVVLPNGKIAVAGPAYIDVTFCGTDACASPGFGLAQYNPDGTLDKSFGKDGKVGYRRGTDTNYALAVMPDGKLLTSGGIYDNSRFGMLLLNPDGTKVEKFGDEGWVGTQFGPYHDSARAMTVQTDGKVIVAGSASVDQEDILDGDFALVRFK
jgi:uncharacterized delta-60 repeat protein